MEELRERIGDVGPVSVVGRHSPTPGPYTLIIRDLYIDGKFVREVSRKRVYWNGAIVNEPS